jgi:hypothetical protein
LRHGGVGCGLQHAEKLQPAREIDLDFGLGAAADALLGADIDVRRDIFSRGDGGLRFSRRRRANEDALILMRAGALPVERR